MNVSRKKGPLYLQIKEIIKDRILHGVYPIHITIPSEPQLEEEFQVSKITIRNAIKELALEGYVEKRSGVGTTVIANVSNAKLSKGKRFTELLVEEGHHITKQILRIQKAKWPENAGHSPLSGENCLKIERIYLLNQEPYIYFTHYLSLDLSEKEIWDLQINSLYRFLEEHSIRLESFQDEFGAAIPPKHILDVLKLDQQTALLKRIRRSRDESGKIVEYSEGYYDSEKHNYVVNYSDSF
ncbi:GntR family transcriptional regulator [Metabacillus sp. RGM 3146]|uniref:GntR family transcriptional regulator n=1 Tax=Metabacillus sp. RGM 3146 TaxID=3401092 RepID=UPI003B98F13B